MSHDGVRVEDVRMELRLEFLVNYSLPLFAAVERLRFGVAYTELVALNGACATANFFGSALPVMETIPLTGTGPAAF